MTRRPKMNGRPQGRPNKPGYHHPYYHWYWDNCYYDDWYYYDDYDWYYEDDYYDWDYEYTMKPRAQQTSDMPTSKQAYKKGFADGVRYAKEHNNPMPEPTPEPTPPIKE